VFKCATCRPDRHVSIAREIILEVTSYPNYTPYLHHRAPGSLSNVYIADRVRRRCQHGWQAQFVFITSSCHNVRDKATRETE